MGLAALRRRDILASEMPRRSPYKPPRDTVSITLKKLLIDTGRQALDERQSDLLRNPHSPGGKDDVRVFYAGDITLLNRKSISIVGTREVSDEGWLRASRLARELATSGIVVISGLARGVDTAALESAIAAKGGVAAVIGTPLSKAYPAENYQLQETIWQSHLLLSPFAQDEPVFKGNFPKRNRVMAAISDATVIVEASDTSGTLHQAAECQRLGRWLFVMRSVAEDPSLKWPASFLRGPKTAVLEKTGDVIAAIS
jgi:DNA processing protein